MLRALQKACAVKIRVCVQQALFLGSRGLAPGEPSADSVLSNACTQHTSSPHSLPLSLHAPEAVCGWSFSGCLHFFHLSRAIIGNLIKRGFHRAFQTRAFQGWSHDPCKREEGVKSRGKLGGRENRNRSKEMRLRENRQ